MTKRQPRAGEARNRLQPEGESAETIMNRMAGHGPEFLIGDTEVMRHSLLAAHNEQPVSCFEAFETLSLWVVAALREIDMRRKAEGKPEVTYPARDDPMMSIKLPMWVAMELFKGWHQAVRDISEREAEEERPPLVERRMPLGQALGLSIGDGSRSVAEGHAKRLRAFRIAVEIAAVKAQNPGTTDRAAFIAVAAKRGVDAKTAQRAWKAYKDIAVPLALG